MLGWMSCVYVFLTVCECFLAVPWQEIMSVFSISECKLGESVIVARKQLCHCFTALQKHCNYKSKTENSAPNNGTIIYRRYSHVDYTVSKVMKGGARIEHVRGLAEKYNTEKSNTNFIAHEVRVALNKFNEHHHVSILSRTGRF